MSQVCEKLKPYYTQKEEGFYTSLSVPFLTAPYTSTSFQSMTLFFCCIFYQMFISLFSQKGPEGCVKTKFRGPTKDMSADEIVRPASISVTFHFDFAVIPAANVEKLHNLLSTGGGAAIQEALPLVKTMQTFKPKVGELAINR